MTPDPFYDGSRLNQTATGNTGPTIQAGRDIRGDIFITRRAKLPVFPIQHEDREPATDPLWVHTPTPQQAALLLASHGLAVILGEPGTGRRTSAIRALQIHLSTLAEPPSLYDLFPDWDDDETPDEEVLPKSAAGHGYLLDATSRPLTAKTASALTSWAGKLHASGGCLVITGTPRDWGEDGRFTVSMRSPDALKIARNYLAGPLKSPDKADWLLADPSRQASRGLFGGAGNPEPTSGVLSGLVTNGVSPSDAVAIARRLKEIPPERLIRALEQQRNAKDPEAKEQAAAEIEQIKDEVREWSQFLEKVLVEPGTRGQDRVMLLAASYLEGAPLEVCIKAATVFDGNGDTASRRYREGRSPRKRMQQVGVDVTEDDKAAFRRRPGLAKSAIRMDWHHWTNERTETTEWIKRITAPGAVAEGWIKQIGLLLLELSRTAAEAPFFSVVQEWAASANSPESKRIEVVTGLLSRAAQTQELAGETHRKMLDWAKGADPLLKSVVALVCSGSYGTIWPHKAFTRLRWILGQDQSNHASDTAATALLTHATESKDGLNRVVQAVDSWLDKTPNHPAGPRAFLTLADPAKAGNVLTSLVTSAQSFPPVRDFLITAWTRTLAHPAVRDRAYSVLLAWAQAVHDGHLDRVFTFELLTDIRNVHTPQDALFHFLYGNPGDEDPALIEARAALANLRACNHTRCDQPDCPLKKNPSAHDGGAAETRETGDTAS
ncbi:hypothetical protein GCM10010406_49800 [Streptomyces thermolineatus]|uniref:Uncharacterized protein n=1 Tax=Streptomyces thermolineatus TaxID=44033 RepID=A0ABP6A1I0_9ACTN